MIHPLRILRLCSVFEPPDTAVTGRGTSFDPIGGLQNHVAALTRALDRRGVVQHVVTSRPPTAPWRERLGARATVYRLGLPVPWFRQLYGVPAAALAPVLAGRADLVHVHLGEDLAVVPIGLAAALLRRLPLVLTVHCSLRHTLQASDVRTRILEIVGGAFERLGQERAAAVIVLTRRLARELERTGLDPARIHVVPSGVDPSLFAGEFRDPFPELGRPRVVFIGRLVVQKGVDTLIRAVPQLETEGALVLLVGDGPDRSLLEALVRELGVEERVRFTGFVPHPRVPAVLRHADLLVLPSVYEEMGSVLLEGMQMGVPIVASRTGGIPDVITHGETGLLVEPSEPRALAAAIDRVLWDDGLARRLATCAEGEAKRYDWNVLADKVLGIYLGVQRVSGRPGGKP